MYLHRYLVHCVSDNVIKHLSYEFYNYKIIVLLLLLFFIQQSLSAKIH